MFARFADLPQARAWFEAWLREAALPLWSTAGVDPRNGSFHEALTAEGCGVPGPRRSRVQSRQIWVFATAGRRFARPDWAAVSRRGLAAYQARYRTDDDLYVRAVGDDGAVADGALWLYEQAFALLALSASDDPAAGAAATATRDGLERFRHPPGGYREAGDQPFQSNALMHLLEAALAWRGRDDPAWERLADAVAIHALERLFDPGLGVIHEFFDDRWTPLPGAQGGRVEPGHQFEWAWLLELWAQARGHAGAQAAARRLYAAGLAGVDPQRSVAVGALWGDMTVREPAGRLWAQTEWLRAALRFGSEAEALRAAAAVAGYLEAAPRGAWRDRMSAEGVLDSDPAPATSLYHLLAAILPLLDDA